MSGAFRKSSRTDEVNPGILRHFSLDLIKTTLEPLQPSWIPLPSNNRHKNTRYIKNSQWEYNDFS
jgi:hypothetical protein